MFLKGLGDRFWLGENSFGILRREVWKGTVIFYTYSFHPVMEVCSDMGKPALQDFIGADPDGRVSFQVERPVSFHIRKHQPVIPLGSIYLCTS